MKKLFIIFLLFACSPNKPGSGPFPDNIIIGKNACVYYIDQHNMLCLKSKTVDVDEQITDHERKLINLTITAILENQREKDSLNITY